MDRRQAPPGLFSQLLPHTLMGVCLGLAFALVLLFTDATHLSEFFSRNPDPLATEWIFALGLSLEFAVGATLTGYVFIATGGD